MPGGKAAVWRDSERDGDTVQTDLFQDDQRDESGAPAF
jgi:hypothetical protein